MSSLALQSLETYKALFMFHQRYAQYRLGIMRNRSVLTEAQKEVKISLAILKCTVTNFDACIIIVFLKKVKCNLFQAEDR